MTRPEEVLRGELRKTGIYKVVYLLAGLGLCLIGVSLLVMLIIRRDPPALFLAMGAFVFGALMFNQALRTRERRDDLEAELEHVTGTGTAAASDTERGSAPGEAER